MKRHDKIWFFNLFAHAALLGLFEKFGNMPNWLMGIAAAFLLMSWFIWMKRIDAVAESERRKGGETDGD